MSHLNLGKVVFGLFIIIVVLNSCSSSDKTEILSAETLYNQAIELFKDEEFLDARIKFDAIKIQYPASQYADDAQFYVAECYYMREEYVLAAYNYNSLRRVYPNSPYYKECMYKVGLCYFNNSPAYDRDQDYTLKAIKALSEFQSIYPDDSLAKISNENLIDLRNRLAEREYFTAGLYRKLRSPNSSLIYYDEVISKYDDTKFYEDSYLGKIEVLIEMKKYDKAMNAIDIYNSLFKNGKYQSRIQELEVLVPQEFK